MSSYYDSSSCLEKLEDQIATHRTIVLASVFLTYVCLVVRNARKEAFRANPSLGAKTLFGFASVKFIIGVLLATVFFPHCPDGCTCTDIPSESYFYPTLVFVIACFWASRGYQYHQMAHLTRNSTTSSSEESSGIV